MEDKSLIIGYHATNKKNIENIKKEGFYISKNKKNYKGKSKFHWLGDGVYFFKYLSDAKSWALNINNCKNDPIIIKTKTYIDLDKILDLDDPSEFNGFLQFLDMFLGQMESTDNIIREFNIKSDSQLISWGLNELKIIKEIDLIQYTFRNNRTKIHFHYLSSTFQKHFNKNSVYNKNNYPKYDYNEVQYCITDEKNIPKSSLSMIELS